MAEEYIKKIRTSSGDKQIDYEALANLPTVKNTIDETATEKELASAKAVYDVVGKVETALDSIIAIQNQLLGVSE